MNRILELWNIRDASVEPITETAWRIDHRYILKKYSEKSQLDKNISIINEMKKI